MIYVNIDHAGEKHTRRSCTGYFVFMNTALVQWFSKQQATIKIQFLALSSWQRKLKSKVVMIILINSPTAVVILKLIQNGNLRM